MKSRVLQAIILLIVFVIGVVLFNSGNNDTPTTDSSGYVPPSP